MRALESGALADDDPTVLEESSFCLGCRACEPVCPAGVQYGALLEEWRAHAWTPQRRSLKLKGLLWAVNSRWRVRAMGLPVPHARRSRGDDGAPTLMLGCFERAMFPAVSRAARKLVPGLKVAPKQGCCGALHAHNGELERGKALAAELGEELGGHDPHHLRRLRRAPGVRARPRARARALPVPRSTTPTTPRRRGAPPRTPAARARGSPCRTPATCATASAWRPSRAR